MQRICENEHMNLNASDFEQDEHSNNKQSVCEDEQSGLER